PITYSKAPTDLKTKKKKNTPSSKPKSPYKVRVILPKKQVIETQHAEVTVATADATQRLEASESAEEKVNQPTAAEAKKIKIIKSYQAATISGSLFIHQSSSYDQDVIDITPKDAKEGDASESLSGLRSMPDDDLASMTGFEIQDSDDHVFEEGTETLHASADKPTQSDPLGHLHEELYLLHNKVNQLESSITKHVSDSIQSTMPLIVTNTLKEQLPGLLSNALKDTLPRLIKDSIKSSVSESIAEELSQVEAQVQKNLQDQLPNILLKPMYKEFNAFNKLESQIIVLIQKELSKSLYNKMRKSIRLKDLQIMFKDMVSLLEAAKVFKKANAITIQKTNTPYPSRRYGVSVPALTKRPQKTKDQYAESSDDEDEIAEVFRIDTNIFDYKTSICSAFNEFNYLLKNGQRVAGKKMVTVMEEILPGTYIIENQLYYQDYEWYEALDDCELKEKALRNKAIMDGVINNDESRCELKRKWNIYTNDNKLN
ncbi:hypothetical protein Tco_1119604, partial [Tanacetum coccineum]